EGRAAGVAGVDRGVDLDRVRDRRALRGLRRGRDGTVQRRDDAGGDRAGEAERVADRHHRFADLQVVGGAERRRLEVAGRVDEADDREVRGRVEADDL